MASTILKYKWPEKSSLSRGAFEIVRKLRARGHKAYLAGGAVRDVILKRPLQEIDIATSAKPAVVKRLFPKTIPTGEKHGTITVRLNKINYEVTTFRLEGPYEKYRRPTKVKFVDSAEIDAKRRDFTINALFYDPESKEVIDHVNGIADLSHQRIRFIGDPDARIKEDALRLLRAVRFATILDFGLEKETRKAIQKNARLITKISAERIKTELDKILMSRQPSVGFGLLDIVGLTECILPELKATQKVTQPKNEHSEGDVYAHTLLALEQFDETYDLPVRYAVMFHDLGKAQTRQVRDKRITFYDHPNVGAKLAENICKRLKFSSRDTAKISWLVKSHLVPMDFAKMKLSTRRRWGLNSYFSELLKVFLADAKASIPAAGKPNKMPRAHLEGLKILEEIKARPILRKPLLSGYDVMKIFKIKSGPLVGKILRLVEEKKLASKIKNKKAAITFLQKNQKKILKKLDK
jgi:poly(A) polymerase